LFKFIYYLFLTTTVIHYYIALEMAVADHSVL